MSDCYLCRKPLHGDSSSVDIKRWDPRRNVFFDETRRACAECVRRRNGYQSRRAKARRDAAASCSTNGLTNKWRWTMSWLDDLYRIVGKGDVRDSDFILNGESFYCPQCGRHLKAATGTVKGSEEKRYRFKCVDRMHYRTKWHESYQAALMEMIKTFEKGENA